MAVINELLRTNEDGTLSFGNYELNAKQKKSDYEFQGDLYKVKTYREITKLERNEMFFYESVPGTTVTKMKIDNEGIFFYVEGPEDAQITLGVEDESEYDVKVDGQDLGRMQSSMGGKLAFGVELSGTPVLVEVRRVD